MSYSSYAFIGISTNQKMTFLDIKEMLRGIFMRAGQYIFITGE